MTTATLSKPVAETATNTNVPPAPLKTERCESASVTVGGKPARCGADSLVSVRFENGLDLVFCGHHFALIEPDVLIARGVANTIRLKAMVDDETSGFKLKGPA